MLVGVLISIMISIVVGVNLVPTIITSINTARAQAAAVEGFSGLGGLMEVLASNLTGAFTKRFVKQTGQIRGKLNSILEHANLELNRLESRKCVETRGSASLRDDGIVRHSREIWRLTSDVYIAVRNCLTRWQHLVENEPNSGKAKLFKHANPEPSLILEEGVETRRFATKLVEGIVQPIVKAVDMLNSARSSCVGYYQRLHKEIYEANRSNSVEPKSFRIWQYRAKQGSNSWACVETRWATPLGVMV